jgi:hypothetical protein
MANTDQKLIVSELDFFDIKNNLKTFLRDQDEFADFDFDAAGINVLLDILAYNTHYNAYYNNMIANEMFLDTAIMRDSVVSHAKMLGYTPVSSVAPKALVDLQISRPLDSALVSLTLPKFTQFQSSPINSVSYPFVNIDSAIGAYDPSCGRFCFNELALYQGQPLSYSFTYDKTTNPTSSFELPDVGIDTRTLEILVQESSTSLRKQKFTLAQDATVVDTTSPVFYLDESRGGYYKVYFGDDVIGKSLTQGNVVIVTYLITDGASANKANAFSLVQTVGGLSNHIIYPITAASGGTGQETIENIRFTAPKAYVSNNRGVTKDDIIAIVNKNYPYFDAINVWGGEENDPPVYGKIYIAAKPTSGYEITETEKLDVINNVIKPVSVVTVVPEFVNVDYNYLNIFAEVHYDKTQTNNGPDALSTIVKNAIASYNTSDLNDFNSRFKISKLLRNIDDSDISIEYSDAVATITKRLEPVYGVSRNYTLNYGTPISREDPNYRIYSTPAFTQYDNNGILRQCFFEEVPGSSGGIDSITVIAEAFNGFGGEGHVYPPIIEIVGDGTNAVAAAVVVNGQISSINVLYPGYNYKTATAVVHCTDQATTTDGRIVYIDDGRIDYTADLLVNIAGRYGALQSYYFDNNNNKVVLNSAAGTVDYTLGKVILSQFDPVSIDDPMKILRITAKPLSNSFESSRNRILTIDTEDSSAIAVNVKPIQ